MIDADAENTQSSANHLVEEASKKPKWLFVTILTCF
jgi:hypothetical protein